LGLVADRVREGVLLSECRIIMHFSQKLII
jgi:hypothetical protein